MAIATVVSLAPVASAPLAGSAAAAGSASDVPSQQQLAALRAEADAVQAQLTAGTKRLAAAKANLASLQQQAAAAKAAAAKLDAKLVVLRAQISQFASEMYEHPAHDSLTKVLSTTADFNRSLQAAALLTFATEGRTQVVREVTVDTEQAKVLRAQADQDVTAAATIQKSVDAQVAALQDQAGKAASRLEAAEAAYEKEQARLAAERAAKAKAAADEAARKAAERRAQELASQSASAAACSTTSHGPYPSGRWGGFSNGLIPASQMCSIIGGGRLRPDAAVAFNKMSQAYARAFGSPLCVTASYRPYSDQVRLYRIEPSLAAIPGTSNHGWGVAVDLGCGVQNYGSAQYRWMTQHAGAYGWVHPSWALHNPFEPWHWEYGNPGGSGGT